MMPLRETWETNLSEAIKTLNGFISLPEAARYPSSQHGFRQQTFQGTDRPGHSQSEPPQVETHNGEADMLIKATTAEQANFALRSFVV